MPLCLSGWEFRKSTHLQAPLNLKPPVSSAGRGGSLNARFLCRGNSGVLGWRVFSDRALSTLSNTPRAGTGPSSLTQRRHPGRRRVRTRGYSRREVRGRPGRPDAARACRRRRRGARRGLIRGLSYVSHKNRKAVAEGLKAVYQAATSKRPSGSSRTSRRRGIAVTRSSPAPGDRTGEELSRCSPTPRRSGVPSIRRTR